MAGPIEFWFSIGSTYTYLSVMRVDVFAREHAVDVVWRPFNVRTITQLMNNRPFVGKPIKAAYMWRDIERRAAWRNLPVRVPAPYPLENMELANRVAIVADQQGWLNAYVTEAYRRWMVDGQMAGSEPNLSGSIIACGRDPEVIVNKAKDAATGASLDRSTDEAMKGGIFGAPTFVVDGEIFWGDDRLEDAVKWLSDKRP